MAEAEGALGRDTGTAICDNRQSTRCRGFAALHRGRLHFIQHYVPTDDLGNPAPDSKPTTRGGCLPSGRRRQSSERLHDVGHAWTASRRLPRRAGDAVSRPLPSPPLLEDQPDFALDRLRRLCASACGPTAGVTPPVAAWLAGRARGVASPAGAGKASAAGPAESPNPSSAGFTWLL